MDAACTAVEWTLQHTICVLPGVQLTSGTSEPPSLRYAGVNVQARGASDLRALVRHPAMQDTRSLELVQAGIEMADPRVLSVGAGSSCLLFIPKTSAEAIFSWKEDDVRLASWDVFGGCTIEALQALPAPREGGDINMSEASAAGDSKRKERVDVDSEALAGAYGQDGSGASGMDPDAASGEQDGSTRKKGAR